MLLKHRSLVVLLFCGFLTTLILPCVSNAQVITTAPVTIISQRTVVESLRKGGYIIYFRHPQTKAEQADTDTSHLENIKAQRQLTPFGEKQAIAIGKAFKDLNIPVGEVFTSQYYRAQKAAKLAGFNNFETLVCLTEPQNVSPHEIQKRAEGLRKLLSIKPKEGTNNEAVGFLHLGVGKTGYEQGVGCREGKYQSHPLIGGVSTYLKHKDFFAHVSVAARSAGEALNLTGRANF